MNSKIHRRKTLTQSITMSQDNKEHNTQQRKLFTSSPYTPVCRGQRHFYLYLLTLFCVSFAVFEVIQRERQMAQNCAVDALLSLWLLCASERRAHRVIDRFCCKRRVSFYIKLIKSSYLMLQYYTYEIFMSLLMLTVPRKFSHGL
jgi:hypothetical protein